MPESNQQAIPSPRWLGPESIEVQEVPLNTTDDLTFIKSEILKALGIVIPDEHSEKIDMIVNVIKRLPGITVPDAIDIADALSVKLSRHIKENYMLSLAQAQLAERHCSPQVVFNEPPAYGEMVHFAAYEQVGAAVINAGALGRLWITSVDPGPVPKYTAAKTEAWLERWHRR